MNENNIWIPNSEHYSGYTDRHAVLSKTNIEPYLNILNNLVFKSHEYFNKMKRNYDSDLYDENDSSSEEGFSDFIRTDEEYLYDQDNQNNMLDERRLLSLIFKENFLEFFNQFDIS